MEEYRGYTIEVVKNNEKQYPYKAIATKGNEQIKHKGLSEEQAVDVVKVSINCMLEKKQTRGKQINI